MERDKLLLASLEYVHSTMLEDKKSSKICASLNRYFSLTTQSPDPNDDAHDDHFLPQHDIRVEILKKNLNETERIKSAGNKVHNVRNIYIYIIFLNISFSPRKSLLGSIDISLVLLCQRGLIEIILQLLVGRRTYHVLTGGDHVACSYHSLLR